jgi:hypothetical protein
MIIILACSQEQLAKMYLLALPCLSVHLYTRNSSRNDDQIFMKFHNEKLY